MRLRMWVRNARPAAKVAPVLVMASVMLTGCGGSSSVAESTPSAGASAAQATKTTADLIEQSPEEVVSEFLDGVRRGGSAADVGRLMSTKSQEQYAAVGLVMQPIGAPDATFEVTRSVPYGESGALVNSLWREKDAEGNPITYEVGWALQKESTGWRVSGLILGDTPEPRVFNFESREDVLALKAMQETLSPEAEQAPRTAEAPTFDMPPLR